MLEKEKIQYRGFRNLYDEAGNATGFEFRIRTQYYRGCWLSQIRHGRVIVDGEEFWPDSGKVTWIVEGKEYTIPEMMKDNLTLWPMNKAATIRVKKPGGLTQGYHDVEMHYFISHSYMPPEMDEFEDTPEGIKGRGYLLQRRMLIV
jgi:hypothetical protein